MPLMNLAVFRPLALAALAFTVACGDSETPSSSGGSSCPDETTAGSSGSSGSSGASGSTGSPEPDPGGGLDDGLGAESFPRANAPCPSSSGGSSSGGSSSGGSSSGGSSSGGSSSGGSSSGGPTKKSLGEDCTSADECSGGHCRKNSSGAGYCTMACKFNADCPKGWGCIGDAPLSDGSVLNGTCRPI